MPNIITPSMAAKQLDVTSRWITELLREGKLKGQKIDGKWYLDPDDFKDFKLERDQGKTGQK